MEASNRPKPTMHQKSPAPMKPVRASLVKDPLPGQEVSVQDDEKKDLPPIRLESRDGLRVIEVRDPNKAKSMTDRGWKLTDKPKTPYKAPEHLTDKPLQGHEGLAALQRSMRPPLTKRQKSTIRKERKNK